MLTTQEYAATSTATSTQVYDVVIMGAGFAGNCQARHLLLNIPGIKIALVDPRPPERSEKDLKVGESLVEIGAMFLYKELKLHEYLIDHHTPKYGLTYHWPKDTGQTKRMDNYHHIWVNGSPNLESFHINRAKFERDLLKMNQEMGATFYNGRVTDIDLSTGEELHTVTVKCDRSKLQLLGKHLVDGAGRRFLLGKKTNTLIFDDENIRGINTGSAWLRVKNIDAKILDPGYQPNVQCANRYYTTHHWMGYGHWVWTIPIAKESKDLSIGIVHHKNAIPAKDINTLEKFKEFLKANHAIVAELIEGGEIVDFHYLPRIAHMSKQMISEDNWYVLGDAGHMFDPFYSPNLVIVSLAVESVTEVIRAKLAGETDAVKKAQMYNQLLVHYQLRYLHLYQKHEKQLGHASVMSWRIYLENMFWFGIFIPMYVGKWFLNFEFIEQFTKSSDYIVLGKKYNLLDDFYGQFDELVDRDINVGLMDYTRADQLIFGYGPEKSVEVNDAFYNTKFELSRWNIYDSLKVTFFFMAVFYLKLRFKGFGIRGVLAPRSLFGFFRLLFEAAYCAIGEQIYLLKTRNISSNTVIENMRKEFEEYRYEPKLQPWRSN